MGRFEMTRDEERKLERLLHEEDLRRLKIAEADVDELVQRDRKLVSELRRTKKKLSAAERTAKDVLKMSRTWGSPEALVSAWPR
jgi:3-methyladenine DNA glycosylase Tag